MIESGVKVGPLPEGPIDWIDNLSSPDIFTEGQTSLFKADKSLIIALYSPRMKPDGTAQRVVVGRLIMQPDKARQLAGEILDFLDQAKIAPSSLT